MIHKVHNVRKGQKGSVPASLRMLQVGERDSNLPYIIKNTVLGAIAFSFQYIG